MFFNSLALGQNYQEIQKLQEEYKKVLERQSLKAPKEVLDAESTVRSTSLPNKLIYTRKDIESLLVSTEKLLIKLKFMEDSVNNMPHAGYEVFTSRDTIPYWQNLPIPKNYNLGPGDELIISLWGESESYNSKTINRDGQIYIDNVGLLNLSGKNISEAKKYIISKYSRVYSTLVGKSPKSFIDVTLGELKSINVHFVGFVNMPGVHLIHPFSNAITGLMQAGGVQTDGSLRTIQIIRNDSLIKTIDIYDYIFLGKSVTDIRLLDQDIILIPSRISLVSIAGEVKKPGYYELLSNETIEYLINVSGGINSTSSKSLFYYDSDKNGFLINSEDFSELTISDGDSIHVPKNPEINRFVKIDGQVKNPGKYPFNKNLTLQQLVKATMTYDDLDFMQTVDLSKIIIFRKNPLSVNPEKILFNLINDNLVLKNGDHISIPKKYLFQPIESIKIGGEVQIPGTYPVNNLTTLTKVLDMAGGITQNAISEGIEIFRDSVKIAWENKNFVLLDGDSLNVIKKSGLVLIKGEVNVPGYISYKKGHSIKKYINRAGGFSSFANKKKVIVIHPNGTAIPNSNWFSPNVLEGSTIVVKQRTLSGSSEDSALETFKEISIVSSNIATTLITLIILSNQSGGGL
jgi:protein involved in polysaccharide export with SLBB domain